VTVAQATITEIWHQARLRKQARTPTAAVTKNRSRGMSSSAVGSTGSLSSRARRLRRSCRESPTSNRAERTARDQCQLRIAVDHSARWNPTDPARLSDSPASISLRKKYESDGN
jgi:hypothetical protein